MKKLLFTQRSLSVVVLCLFIFNSFFSLAQNPLVKMWDKRFGGTYNDDMGCFLQTRDGGYIFGGTSNSGISGDKTEPLRGAIYIPDFWIIKIDSAGNKQWDKTFGGTEDEFLFTCQQTRDGGYIFGGISASGISGDKTEPNRDTVCIIACAYDFWIVKTDSYGNVEWDKTFGGTRSDFLYSLQQTSDNGYILGGYSTRGLTEIKQRIIGTQLYHRVVMTIGL
ncbi:MAG: hypothetical protein ABI763_02840 [Bacteroidota bacterium]